MEVARYAKHSQQSPKGNSTMKGRINMKKRMLAMMMAIVMVMTLLPTSALAAGGDANAPKTSVSVAPDSPVQITKAVSAENGAYKLTLDAYATGTVSTTDPTPSDIVLVLDVSGSMDETFGGQTKLVALKNAVNRFIDETADQNAKITDTAKKNRISIVKFAGDKSDNVGNDTYETGFIFTQTNNYSQIVKGLTTVDPAGQNSLQAEVNKLTAAGATSADYGMALAQTALQDSTDRNKVVVFFTDGEPNHDNDFDVKVAAAAINSAKTLKTAGAKIYTIGVMEGADPNDTTNRNINKYMNAVSSNYPTASATGIKHLLTSKINITWGGRAEGSYYKAASNASELANIFDEISTEITSGVEADDTSVLTDTISEYFVPSGITADADGKVNSGVKVSKVAASGTGAAPEWGTPEDITSQVTVTLNGKTIEVTGFDYSDKDSLVVQKNGNWQGYKLQLEFNIAADKECTTWQSGTYYYPTNVAEANNKKNAGLAYGENGKTELTESPEVAVTAYSVTYNGNGSTGGEVTDAKAYIPGATVTVQKNTFTKTGYQFTAWNTQENGKGTAYTDTTDTFTMANENVTLYAQWEKDENVTKDASYRVEYYKDGENVVGDTQTVQQNIWVGSNTLTVNKADINTKDKYAGYVFEKTEPASIPETIEDKGVIKVYYAKDENGDQIPDKYQALVKFESADATKGAVTGKGAVQVFTFKDNATKGDVTPALTNVELQPKDGFVFDYWTKDNGTEPVDPATTIKDVPGGTTITFKANWKSNVVTITFDANGGAWAEDVAGYTMGAENKTASKKFKLSDTVEKITPDPANGTKKFVGWGISADATEPLSLWVLSPKAAKLKELTKGTGILYAIWEDAAQPTEKLNYTTRQHYIDEKGNEVATVDVGGVDLLALQGTKISDLIKHLETDQNYFGQKYLYDGTKTTVNDAAYKADTMTLDTKGTAIDLYYYLDEWNDKDDTLTGGDGTPDCQQAVVNFLADPNGTVSKDGATQVFTLKKGKDGKYSDSVTPANVTPIPNENFVFDIWTKDNDETGVNPFVAQTLNGGDKVTYTAHFAADKIGPENKPDNIPDKYQAVVTYKVVGGTWKDGKTDDQVQVFTLKNKNADGAWVEVTPAPVLGDTIPTGMISSYSRTASQSWDKDITKDTKVTESVTYTYTFTKGSSGGGGGSSTHYYISLKKVDAQDGEALSGAKFGLYLDGKQIATATSDRNGIVRFSMGSSNYRSLTDKSNLYCQELTAPEGYKLSNEKIAVSKKDVSTSSSTSDKNAKTVKNSRSKTPSMLNGEDHFAYIVGYPDKTVHPQSSITRAEVATIFFRLLTEETRTANATKTNNYADVSSDNWYNQAVSTLSAMGIIKGDSRGNFNPNAPITRAEFAAIAARFDKTEDVAAASFGDVAMHWAKPEISVAANNGWINGYTDGTFHPDSKITRAEAMAMINRVLQRLPESKADLLDGMIQWSDNADTSKWYYLAVQEATNSHYYELKANQHEKWTKLRENRDWTELEK